VKAQVWLAVTGEEVEGGQVTELVPGKGVTLRFRIDGAHLGALLAADRHPERWLQVVIEPAAGGDDDVPATSRVTSDELQAAFEKWAKADKDTALPAVRHLGWTIWRAAYYWAAILRAEGYAAAMAALDPPALRLP
jgi:hypothetical protein